MNPRQTTSAAPPKETLKTNDNSGSPVAVSDPKIRKLLQLAGLRFVCSRARWLDSEAARLGVALTAGQMTSGEVDAELERMGALDLVYPELMGCDGC
jgi:hypothetical protein